MEDCETRLQLGKIPDKEKIIYAITWGGGTAKELAKTAAVKLDDTEEWEAAKKKLRATVQKGICLSFVKVICLHTALKDIERDTLERDS